MRGELSAHPDENWEVWLDWWEARRDGNPYHIDMEREIVLIPDEDWAKGPAHVNALIAEIRGRYGKQTVAAADVSPVDFTHIDSFMQMVPFRAERLRVEDEASLDLLSELSDSAGDLAGDLNDASSQIPITFKRNVRRYAEEAAKAPSDVRPGRLHDLARLIRKAMRKPEVTDAVPDLIDDSIRQYMDKHLQFMRVVTATTLVRFENLKDVRMAKDGSAEAVADGIRDAVASLDDIGLQAPPLDEDGRAVLSSMEEEIREIAAEAQMTFDPTKRAEREEEAREKAASSGASLLHYTATGTRAAITVTNTAAAAQTLWPKKFAEAIAWVMTQFENFDPPWS